MLLESAEAPQRRAALLEEALTIVKPRHCWRVSVKIYQILAMQGLEGDLLIHLSIFIERPHVACPPGQLKGWTVERLRPQGTRAALVLVVLGVGAGVVYGIMIAMS